MTIGDNFGSLKEQSARIVGTMLLGIAFLLLILMPEDFSPMLFYGYLLCGILGFLLVAGYIGTDPVASRLRRQATEPVGRSGRFPADAPPSVFRYPTSPLRYAVVLLVSVSCLLGAGVICWLAPGVDRVIALLPLFLIGGLGPLYAYRYSQICIRVDERGLRARTWLRDVSLGWDEIIALIQHDLPPTPARFRVYKVYSRHKKLVFYDTLKGDADLASLIRCVTGLDWTSPSREAKK